MASAMDLRLHELSINFTKQELYNEMDLFVRQSSTTLWSVEMLSDHSEMYLWFVKMGTLKIIRVSLSPGAFLLCWHLVKIYQQYSLKSSDH